MADRASSLAGARKVLTVVGARPQFVKAAVVSPALRDAGLREVLVHTGQHYDWEMSTAFFEGLDLPEPVYNLAIGSASHGAQTGRMLEGLERVMLEERPEMVIIYGDTNSTLAGAVAAAKLHLPVAHIEAGLRSFDRRMPEEVNRVLADHVSTLLFAPTTAAVENLSREGVTHGVIRTGDVMFDLVVKLRAAIGGAVDEVTRRLGVTRGNYALVTLHRAENTDDPARWAAILRGLALIAEAGLPILWPVHPRTRELVNDFSTPGVTLLDPQPYLETQALLAGARVVVTDSGGLQKEAAFHGKPCVTVRDRTEWVELCEAGVNHLAGWDSRAIAELAAGAAWPAAGLPPDLYGDGRSAEATAGAIAAFLGEAASIGASGAQSNGARP